MKKLDKLLLKSFIGPFILTFLVSVFILLTQYMLKYFDEFVGKDLGFGVFAELIGYFSINMTPIALPLAVLISSLMTYGKLGEHFELTAIKGSGISLLRTLRPTFIFVVILSIGAFFSNDNLVPSANLRAYSLLYDIKHKKPSLDLKEGQFYGGIPNYSIKVKKKYPGGIAMRDVIIYDHKNSSGNKKIILADSCRMYTILNDRYLMMELFDGNHYLEQKKKKKGSRKGKIDDFARTNFKSMKLVFSLASFELANTDKDLFAGNRMMKDIGDLSQSIDSMGSQIIHAQYALFRTLSSTYRLHLDGEIKPPGDLELAKELLDEQNRKRDSLYTAYKSKETQERDSARQSVDKMADARQEVNRSKSGFNGQKPSLKSKKVKDLTNEEGSALVATKSNPNKIAARGKSNPQVVKPKVGMGEVVPVGSTFLSKMDKGKFASSTPKIDTALLSNIPALELLKMKIDSFSQKSVNKKHILSRAVGGARNIKSNVHTNKSKLESLKKQIDSHTMEKHKKFSQAFSCIVMFLIGAPLGAIIKRGGLGVPVIISVFFFIIFYVLSLFGEKWAKQGLMDGLYAAWLANAVLLPIGIFFLRQARLDTKLFDADFYNVFFDKIKRGIKKRKANLKLSQ